MSQRPRYAARLNAFKMNAHSYWPGQNRITILDLIARAGTVDGMDAADLNYPDHFEGVSQADVEIALAGAGMSLNGLAMRYYTDPGFKIGAFTNPDPAIRRSAIDLTRKGLDTLAAMGGKQMTLWMGQDGFDYGFQADYTRLWDDSIDALAQVADHNPDLEIAIEYKPNEPRAFALMPDVATTLLAIKEAGRDNIGVTLDFCHVLFADEMPAHTAALIGRHSKLMGVHLNDGYGKRDDGLMVGTVHPIQTVELLVEMARQGYDNAIYFDTFPDHGGLDPVAEATTNIAAVEALRAVADNLKDNTELSAAINRQDAALSQRIVQSALFARPGGRG